MDLEKGPLHCGHPTGLRLRGGPGLISLRPPPYLPGMSTRACPPRRSKDATAWESEACGDRYGVQQDRRPYELEPEIVSFTDFPSAAEKSVLEIPRDATQLRLLDTSRVRCTSM
jgi:hypothetical protein